jgi:hypothetical protein
VRAAKTGKDEKDEDPLNKDVSVTVKSTTSNPMMRQQAVGDDEDEDGSHALMTAEKALLMDMKMLGESPPQDADQWREFKSRFEEQAKQVHQLSQSIAALRRDKVKASMTAGAGDDRSAAISASFARAAAGGRAISRRDSFKVAKAGGSRRKNVLKK